MKKEFKKGDRVNYLEFDGSTDPSTVTSVNEKYVFVLFDKYSAQHCTSQACNPNDLEKWGSHDICELEKSSLLEWLKKDGGDNVIAEDTVGLLLGHGHLHDNAGE